MFSAYHLHLQKVTSLFLTSEPKLEKKEIDGIITFFPERLKYATWELDKWFYIPSKHSRA
jgi:hypothetical protein